MSGIDVEGGGPGADLGNGASMSGSDEGISLVYSFFLKKSFRVLGLTEFRLPVQTLLSSLFLLAGQGEVEISQRK